MMCPISGQLGLIDLAYSVLLYYRHSLSLWGLCTSLLICYVHSLSWGGVPHFLDRDLWG